MTCAVANAFTQILLQETSENSVQNILPKSELGALPSAVRSGRPSLAQTPEISTVLFKCSSILRPIGSCSQSAFPYCNPVPHTPCRLLPRLPPLCEGSASLLSADALGLSSARTTWGLLAPWRVRPLNCRCLGQGLHRLCVCVGAIQTHPCDTTEILQTIIVCQA